MRVWLAILFAVAAVSVARALPSNQQIIIFGGQSSASGSGGGGTGACSTGSLMNGTFDLTNTCNDIYFIGGLK